MAGGVCRVLRPTLRLHPTHRLARRLEHIFSPGGIDELYHLGNDPHERHNLAQDPAFREVLHAMVKRMWRKMRAIGDESLLKTEYATLRIAPVGPGN